MGRENDFKNFVLIEDKINSHFPVFSTLDLYLEKVLHQIIWSLTTVSVFIQTNTGKFDRCEQIYVFIEASLTVNS